MDKSIVLKGFNNHFFEFMDDIITIIPDNNDLKTTKTFLMRRKRETPYANVLDSGNLELFINKSYSEDIVNLMPRIFFRR